MSQVFEGATLPVEILPSVWPVCNEFIRVYDKLYYIIIQLCAVHKLEFWPRFKRF